jgi:hypothetical protein
MGRRGSIEWPPRSPDLSPPDFFASGVVKDAVYSKKPTSIDQLQNEIVNEKCCIIRKKLSRKNNFENKISKVGSSKIYNLES